MKYLYGLILFRSITSSILKNNKINIPTKICKDCKYFIGNERKCKYFNDIDLVTGQKTFNYASIMRDNECGKEAKYFEENKIKFITEPYYFLKDYWMFIPTVLFTILYITVISIKK
jgi:hypothetical protein